jgi:hypothetical protein
VCVCPPVLVLLHQGHPLKPIPRTYSVSVILKVGHHSQPRNQEYPPKTNERLILIVTKINKSNVCFDQDGR